MGEKGPKVVGDWDDIKAVLSYLSNKFDDIGVSMLRSRPWHLVRKSVSSPLFSENAKRIWSSAQEAFCNKVSLIMIRHCMHEDGKLLRQLADEGTFEVRGDYFNQNLIFPTIQYLNDDEGHLQKLEITYYGDEEYSFSSSNPQQAIVELPLNGISSSISLNSPNNELANYSIFGGVAKGSKFPKTRANKQDKSKPPAQTDLLAVSGTATESTSSISSPAVATSFAKKRFSKASTTSVRDSPILSSRPKRDCAKPTYLGNEQALSPPAATVKKQKTASKKSRDSAGKNTKHARPIDKSTSDADRLQETTFEDTFDEHYDSNSSIQNHTVQPLLSTIKANITDMKPAKHVEKKKMNDVNGVANSDSFRDQLEVQKQAVAAKEKELDDMQNELRAQKMALWTEQTKKTDAIAKSKIDVLNLQLDHARDNAVQVAAIAAEKMANEKDIAAQKMASEKDLAAQKLASERELAAEKIAFAKEIAAAKVASAEAMAAEKLAFVKAQAAETMAYEKARNDSEIQRLRDENMLLQTEAGNPKLSMLAKVKELALVNSHHEAILNAIDKSEDKTEKKVLSILENVASIANIGTKAQADVVGKIVGWKYGMHAAKQQQEDEKSLAIAHRKEMKRKAELEEEHALEETMRKCEQRLSESRARRQHAIEKQGGESENHCLW